MNAAMEEAASTARRGRMNAKQSGLTRRVLSLARYEALVEAFGGEQPAVKKGQPE